MQFLQTYSEQYLQLVTESLHFTTQQTAEWLQTIQVWLVEQFLQKCRPQLWHLPCISPQLFSSHWGILIRGQVCWIGVGLGEIIQVHHDERDWVPKTERTHVIWEAVAFSMCVATLYACNAVYCCLCLWYAVCFWVLQTFKFWPVLIKTYICQVLYVAMNMRTLNLLELAPVSTDE